MNQVILGGGYPPLETHSTSTVSLGWYLEKDGPVLPTAVPFLSLNNSFYFCEILIFFVKSVSTYIQNKF